MGIVIQNGIAEEGIVGAIEIAGAGINDEKYYWVQDFDEEVATVNMTTTGLRADEWTIGGTNSTDVDVTYIAGSGGVVQLQTDGADDDSEGIYHIGTNILVNSNPIFEVRFQLATITASTEGCLLGLTETVNILDMAAISGVSDDYIAIGIDTDEADPENLRLFTNDDGGGDLIVDLGVAITAGTWCTVRVDCTNNDLPKIYVDVTGGAIQPQHEIASATIGLTATILAGIAMFPFLFVQGLDGTVATLLVDYIKIWQDRG